MLAEQADRRQDLERRDVPGAGHDDVWLRSFVVTGPLPDPDAGSTMPYRIVDCQALERRLLAGDDDIDVIATAQNVVGHGEKRIRVGREVNPDHVCLLIDGVVDESRVLVGKAVVVLPPDVRRQKVVQGGDRPTPGNV